MIATDDNTVNRFKTNIVEKNIARRKVVRSLKLFTLVIGCVAHYYTITTYYRSTLAVNGAEINATHEWTLVQEGDTIPAGLHVRMDLSTGEKWVKLVDEEDEEDNNNNYIMDDTEKIRAVEISADGKNTAVTTSLTATITDSSEKDKDEEGEPKYDFMMMHRTLSKLDNDEIERIGGLPEIPLTSKHHQQQQQTQEWIDFESRMLEIWTARQTELQELSHADLPKIIKDLINCLKQYIEMGKVRQFQFEGFSGDIIDVLKDLEFHMSDIDMARDFHTLDGWHLLVSLLDDSTHMKAAKATENENDENSQSFVEYKQRVQSTAAWAIGTAVKNTEEFFSWSIENILTSKMKSLGYDHPISRGGGVTVIDLLLEQLNQTTAIIIDNYSTNDRTNKDTTSNRIPLMYKQKLVYALGSSLRLNNVAQEYFDSIGGPLILGEVMEGSLKTLDLMDAKDKRKEYKSTLKLLTLVSDIIIYLQESLAEGMFSREEFSAKISQYTSSSSFSKEGTNNENNIWCKSALTSLQDAHILKDLSSQEKVLEILSTLGPFCRTHDNPDASSTLREFLQGLLKEYRGMEQSDLSEDDEDDLFGMDEEWKYDMIKMAENILDAIN